MAFMDMFNPIVGVFMDPLLGLDPLWAVLIVSVVVSFLISVIYKMTTDQNLMKQLKDEMQELQKEAKELREHPEKAMEVQKQMMETNMKYMMQSMRATFFTIIPVILIFGWMSANFAYTPLYVGDEFTVTAYFDGDTVAQLNAPEGLEIISKNQQPVAAGQAQWSLKGEEAGDYLMQFTYNDKMYTVPLYISSGERKYAPNTKSIGVDGFKRVDINYKKLPILPWIGWGWLGSYIVFSIISSMLIRKWLKVY